MPAGDVFVPLVEDHQRLDDRGDVPDEGLGLLRGEPAGEIAGGVVLCEGGSAGDLTPSLDDRVLARCGQQVARRGRGSRLGPCVRQGAGELDRWTAAAVGLERVGVAWRKVGEQHLARYLHRLATPDEHGLAVLPDHLPMCLALGRVPVAEAVLDAVLPHQSSKFGAHGGAGPAVHQRMSSTIALSRRARRSSTWSSSTPWVLSSSSAWAARLSSSSECVGRP